MKKITALLLTIGVLFGMSACSSKNKIEEEALDAYMKAASKILEYRSANYEMKMNIEQDGTKAKVVMDGGFINDGPLQLSMNLSMSASGISLDDFMNIYVKDDIMYMSAMGKKTKQPLNIEESLSGLNLGIDPETMTDKQSMKKFLTSATKDGNKVKMVFDCDRMNNAMKTLAEDSEDTSTQTYEEAVMEFTVNEKGMLTSLTFTFKATQDGTPISAKLTFELTDVNKVKEVQFPDDLNSYVEQTITDEGNSLLENEDYNYYSEDEDFGF